jgi:hypothetical protein
VNTPKWLAGPRYSNNHEEIDNAFVVHMMEPNLLAQVPTFVNQTICHQDGRFRTIAWNASNQHRVDDWERK